MSTEYRHGVEVVEIDDGPRAISVISTSIIGLVATADDADAATYPLNKPVLLTNLATGLAKAGTKGTLAPTLQAIYRQANAMAVVVRVASNNKPEEQDALTIGAFADGRYTGLKALLAANAQLGVRPKIIGAPGLDSQAVVTEMVSVSKKLNAFVYAKAVGETKEEAVRYRSNFGARELMLIYPKFTGFDEAKGRQNEIEATAVALGLRAKLDNEQGWAKSISNVVVDGVAGLSADVDFAFTDTAHDAHYLNTNAITTLVREDGFRLWGNRTTASDQLFYFETYTRTAQVLKETMARAHLWAVDKKLTPGLASDIAEGVNAFMRQLTNNNDLLGGSAWYEPNANNAEQLRQGQLVLDYDYTPVPPLEHLKLRQRITDKYLIDFARRIEQAQGV